MRWLRRLLRRWFGPLSFQKLLAEAQERGRVSMQQVEIGRRSASRTPRIGWYVSIRPPDKRGPHAHRYAWTGQHEDLVTAFEDAVEEMREFPVMVDMTKDNNAPRLGGREFDEE